MVGDKTTKESEVDMFRRPGRVLRRTARRIRHRMFFRMAIHEKDIARVEKETGQSVDNLTEQQLLDAMKRLRIKKLELED